MNEDFVKIPRSYLVYFLIIYTGSILGTEPVYIICLTPCILYVSIYIICLNRVSSTGSLSCAEQYLEFLLITICPYPYVFPHNKYAPRELKPSQLQYVKRDGFDRAGRNNNSHISRHHGSSIGDPLEIP